MYTQGDLTYVAGGCNGEYYAQLSDGSVLWGGNVCARFSELVRVGPDLGLSDLGFRVSPQPQPP